MRHIIHDWDDDKSLAILRNCCKAAGQKGKLLLLKVSCLKETSHPSASFSIWR